MRNAVFTALMALVFGFVGAGLWSVSGLGDAHTRSWLVANPEILPDMAAAYQKRQAQARLAEVGPAAIQPFPGAVLGNPAGERTLVKFTDYGCTYCRASEKDVQALIKSDPGLRIVIREWPIFDGSEAAARMALAAAAQGKYAAFYSAMFAGEQPSPASIEKAAATAGLDLGKARAFAASQAVTDEIGRNTELARQLGFTGTPSWIAQGQILEGAVGFEKLKAALSGKAG